MSKIYKPIMYYHVRTSNRGDMAICKSITDAIKQRIDIPFSFFNVKTDELTEDRILHQLNKDCSALIIAGSGLYTNYPKSSNWYFPCKTELFRKIKVPIILLGLGNNKNLRGNILNTELKLETKESIKLINNLASISTVRDQRTYDLLKSIGINKHKLLLDPACFLNVPKLKREKRVAINIAQHAPILGRFDGGKEGQKNRDKNLACFSEICDYLNILGYSIVFIAMDALEQSLIIDLKDRCPYIEYINTNNIDTILKEYAKCSFSIGIRMHANILSFASATPFISLYYDIKSVEFMNLIGWHFGKSIFDNYSKWVLDRVNIFDDNYKNFSKYFDRIKITNKVDFDNIIDKACTTIKTSR